MYGRGTEPPTSAREGSRLSRLRPTRAQLASAAGDTLIEVIISALLVGLIVVGTFSGLNSANRSTSIDRARSQADALAEQNQEEMRSYPIKKLDHLTSLAETKTVTAGKTVFTIEESAAYKQEEEENDSSSCSSSSTSTEYLKTTSKVTSPSISGKAVEESSIISPPAGSALVVQVQESGTALPGAKVVATGPSPATTPYELETSSKGCAILAVPPGEYNIYVSKAGFVTANWYQNTHEDLSTTRSVYLPAETTAKEGYNIGEAGKLAVSFITGSTASEGDSFVAFNPLMSSYSPVKTAPIGTYKSTVESPNSVFPFKSQYTVYAGTCEADSPSAAVIKEHESNFLTPVLPGETTPPRTITTIQPPVNIKVWTGTGPGSQGMSVTNGAGSTTDACGVKRSFASAVGSTPNGGLPHPGLPFGKYSSICVSSGGRKWEDPEFENNTVNGPTVGSTVTPPNNGGVEEIGGTRYGMVYLSSPTNTSSGVCT